MMEKKFNAILAKNAIAREVKYYLKNKECINVNYIIYFLKDIELFLGSGNQPDINDILTSEFDI